MEVRTKAIDAVSAFDAKHGSNSVEIDGWLVFSDGAKRAIVQPGAMQEPPIDEDLLASIQIRYRKVMLKRAIEHAESIKQRRVVPGPESRIRDFEDRHGSEKVRVGNQYVYPDGARREISVYGNHFEPSTDIRERCRTQVQFWEKQLRHAEHRFHECRGQVLAHIEASKRDGYYAASQQRIDELDDLRENVVMIRKRLESARSAYEATDPEINLKEQVNAEKHKANDEFLTAVTNIKI